MNFVCMEYRIDEFVGSVIFKKGQYDNEEQIIDLIRKQLDISDESEVQLCGEGSWRTVRPWTVDKALFWGELEQGEE